MSFFCLLQLNMFTLNAFRNNAKRGDRSLPSTARGNVLRPMWACPFRLMLVFRSWSNNASCAMPVGLLQRNAALDQPAAGHGANRIPPRKRFSQLPPGELAVIANTCEVWLGEVCLWALRSYREVSRHKIRAFGSSQPEKRSATGTETQKRIRPNMPKHNYIKPAVKSDETRMRILHAALELFRERGFEPTTMREIALRAGVATGAAYYYFASKDAIVFAFYRQSAEEMAPQLEEVLAATRDLRKRLVTILDVKLTYFEPSRRLLGALAAHSDPEHPLSPFSHETSEIREQDIGLFRRAISDSKLRVPEDLNAILPRLIWMYQMGIILYWIHDKFPQQTKTRALVQKSLHLIVRLVQLSGLPLMRPLRRQVIELFNEVTG